VITQICWIASIIGLKGFKTLLREFRASPPERLGRRGKKLATKAFEVKLMVCEPQTIE